MQPPFLHNMGLWQSWSMRWTENPVIGVRFPGVPRKHFGSLAQLVERLLGMEKVMGSNPICIHTN